MPIYALPSKSAIVAAIANGTAGAVSTRIADLATRQGYTIGPAGIAILGDGRVVIDVDRDPSADWVAFDPAAPTADEQAVVSLADALRDFENDVQAAHDLMALAVTSTNAVQRLQQTRTVVDGLVTRIDQLVRLLIAREVL